MNVYDIEGNIDFNKTWWGWHQRPFRRNIAVCSSKLSMPQCTRHRTRPLNVNSSAKTSSHHLQRNLRDNARRKHHQRFNNWIAGPQIHWCCSALWYWLRRRKSTFKGATETHWPQNAYTVFSPPTSRLGANWRSLWRRASTWRTKNQTLAQHNSKRCVIAVDNVSGAFIVKVQNNIQSHFCFARFCFCCRRHRIVKIWHFKLTQKNDTILLLFTTHEIWIICLTQSHQHQTL